MNTFVADLAASSFDVALAGRGHRRRERGKPLVRDRVAALRVRS